MTLGDDLALRTAGTGDTRFLHHLYGATRAHEFQMVDPTTAASLLLMQSEARERQYRDSHPAAVDAIILLRGERVGRLLVDRSQASVWLLIDIAVLPNRQRAGIGDKVLRRLLADADAASCAVELNVIVASPPVRWYARHNFLAMAATEVYVSMRRAPMRTGH